MVVSLATVRVPQWFMAFRVDEPLDAHTPAKAMEIGAMVIGGIMAIIGTIIGIGTRFYRNRYLRFRLPIRLR